MPFGEVSACPTCWPPDSLLKLDVTVWTGSAALSAPDLGLDPASIAAHYTLGRKRLVPKQALDPLATVVRQTRYALESLSHPLPDGSRFILDGDRARGRGPAPPRPGALQRGRGGVPRGLSGPPGRDGGGVGGRGGGGLAHGRLPGDETAFIEVFLARIAAAAPTLTELRRKFDFFWWTYSLRLGGTERVELAGAADAERARRARDAAYRAEAEARIGAALERSLAGFRAQVAEACTAVLAHIQSGRPLREGTVERLRRTIRRFRALNFVDDDTLAGELAAFEQACLDGLDPGAVQEAPDVRAVLTAGLQAVVEAATTELPRSVLTGRALRRFDVDTEAGDGPGTPSAPGRSRMPPPPHDPQRIGEATPSSGADGAAPEGGRTR